MASACEQVPPAAGLPPGPAHAAKPSLDDVFEHRWRKAYEVRALERESRGVKGQLAQASSQRNSVDAPPPPPPTEGSAAEPLKSAEAARATIALASLQLEVQAAAGLAAAAALSALHVPALGGGQPGTLSAPAPPAVVAAGASAAAVPRQRSREVIDEEEEEEEEERLAEGQEADDGEPELACRLVWDGSSRRPTTAAAAALSAATTGGDATAGGAAGAAACEEEASVQLKERGNALLKAGDYSAALRCYDDALAAFCGSSAQQPPPQPQPPPGGEHRLLATLHSNRAHVLLKLGRPADAATSALRANQLLPTWTKPLYRLAEAKLALDLWAATVEACRHGERLALAAAENVDCEGHTDFTPMLDRTAVQAARAGSLAGFDGQQLEVRCAGEDAWLGGPAPHAPELDGPLEDDCDGGSCGGSALPALPSSTAAGTLDAGIPCGGGSGAHALPAGDKLAVQLQQQQGGGRRLSFRSVREAVAAARDGDRILLRRGVHNGMGECITLSKRLLVEGEGQLGETVIDQRANCPTFRIVRGGVVLRGLVLDQTGFREALLVEGGGGAGGTGGRGGPVHPLIEGCTIKCSGDDAVNVAGAAAPTLLRCTINAKKCGVRTLGASAPRLERCVLEQCGEQGVHASDSAAPHLHSCTVRECGEEAALAMDAARLALHACTLCDCKGPGVDLSGTATALISGGSVVRCVGGLWLWDGAGAEVGGWAVLEGGPSHAVLADDGGTTIQLRDCTVRGSVHASEAAWQQGGILHPSNTLRDPQQPTDFPAEQGPFRFVPNRFTRKQ